MASEEQTADTDMVPETEGVEEAETTSESQNAAAKTESQDEAANDIALAEIPMPCESKADEDNDPATGIEITVPAEKTTVPEFSN